MGKFLNENSLNHPIIRMNFCNKNVYYTCLRIGIRKKGEKKELNNFNRKIFSHCDLYSTKVSAIKVSASRES